MGRSQDRPGVDNRRRHGVRAELITFGLKIASWFAENQRNMARFGEAAAQVSVGPAFRRKARWVRLK